MFLSLQENSILRLSFSSFRDISRTSPRARSFTRVLSAFHPLTDFFLLALVAFDLQFVPSGSRNLTIRVRYLFRSSFAFLILSVSLSHTFSCFYTFAFSLFHTFAHARSLAPSQARSLSLSE